MVSHDKSLLEQIAHRIVYIEDGQVKKEQANIEHIIGAYHAKQ
jgi:ATPase subunit of ABC transporter with duplicated ATPase domains